MPVRLCSSRQPRCPQALFIALDHSQKAEVWAQVVGKAAGWMNSFVKLIVDGTIPAIVAGKASEQQAAQLQAVSSLCEKVDAHFASFMKYDVDLPPDSWDKQEKEQHPDQEQGFLAVIKSPSKTALYGCSYFGEVGEANSFAKLDNFLQWAKNNVVPPCSTVLLAKFEEPVKELLSACTVADAVILSLEKAVAVETPEGHAPDLATAVEKYKVLGHRIGDAVAQVKDVSLGDLDAGRLFFLQQHALVVCSAVETLGCYECTTFAHLKVTDTIVDHFIKFKTQLDTYTAWVTTSTLARYEAVSGWSKDLDITQRSSAAIRALQLLERKLLGLFDHRAHELAESIYKFAPPASLLDNARLLGYVDLQKTLTDALAGRRRRRAPMIFDHGIGSDRSSARHVATLQRSAAVRGWIVAVGRRLLPPRSCLMPDADVLMLVFGCLGLGVWGLGFGVWGLGQVWALLSPPSPCM